MERTSLQCRLSTTQSRPKSSIWYSKKMFYTEGWKAESPKPGNSNHLLVDSHPEMYYQPPQPVEYHTRTQQPQPANGPYQPVHESELSRTVNPAQVYTSRAPMHFNNDISMSSIQPLMSEKEAQGTLESPFTSKVLRREYDNGGSRSGFSALPSSSPRHPPPAMVEVENEPPTVPEESVKPVLPPLPKRVDQPPRPQNAWILYRSDRLRAIAAGEHIPGLLAVLEEHSLVRAPELNEQKPPNGKESPSSAEGGRFQLFKDAEPSPPVTTSDQLEDNAEESRNKYRRALLQADISKVISMMWRRECQDVKSKYESMAEAKKLEVCSDQSSPY
ncbi:hypothetical protein QFC19_005845 [Naganishia cerealis]|uniref:Uncharacterized protein n=1 Tax=Naganishia cerealis TaxID=610337 RepID=A0ACC2VL72_9TREE|nr:hypothetical protein QFC19_005845 [Naganishia cerealis]